MSQAQKGVCAEPNLHSTYLFFNVIDDDVATVRAKLVRVLERFDFFDNEHYEAMLSGLIGIGSDYWTELYPGLIPLELSPFPDMQCEDRCAPATQCDLFIQIRADRFDICHELATEVMDLLRLHVELIEHVVGFRYLDGRDLNGYIYASDNPRGMKRREVAVVGSSDSDFAGGSYIHVQRYQHDLRRWSSLSNRQQEQIMGVTREHNLASPEQSSFSHHVRASGQLTDDEQPGLLKQGMPYGDLIKQGLMFVSCSASSQPFKAMLHSQIFGSGQNDDYDLWLDYTSAQTGAAFFAPSTQFMREQVKEVED